MWVAYKLVYNVWDLYCTMQLCNRLVKSLNMYVAICVYHVQAAIDCFCVCLLTASVFISLPCIGVCFPTRIDDWRVKWYQYSGEQMVPLFSFGFVQATHYSGASSCPHKSICPRLAWFIPSSKPNISSDSSWCEGLGISNEAILFYSHVHSDVILFLSGLCSLMGEICNIPSTFLHAACCQWKEQYCWGVPHNPLGTNCKLWLRTKPLHEERFYGCFHGPWWSHLPLWKRTPQR